MQVGLIQSVKGLLTLRFPEEGILSQVCPYEGLPEFPVCVGLPYRFQIQDRKTNPDLNFQAASPPADFTFASSTVVEMISQSKFASICTAHWFCFSGDPWLKQ